MAYLKSDKPSYGMGPGRTAREMSYGQFCTIYRTGGLYIESVNWLHFIIPQMIWVYKSGVAMACMAKMAPTALPPAWAPPW